MKKNMVIIYVVNIEKFLFFKRLIDALSEDFNYKFLLVSNSLSVVALARLNNIRCVSICFWPEIKTIPSLENIETSYEERIGEESVLIEKVRRAVFSTMEKNGIKSGADDLCQIVWNGSGLIDQTLVSYVKANGGKTCFLEVGNFPGKLFCDSNGVNYKSSLGKKFDEIYKYTALDFTEWRRSYIEAKLTNHVVPQANYSFLKNFINLTQGLVDKIGFYFFDYAKPVRSVGIFKRMKSFFSARNLIKNIIGLADNELPSKYIFFPLQVVNDTQLVINYRSTLLDAVILANKLAKSRGMTLVIKPHPAETDFEQYKLIWQYCVKENIPWSNINTFLLISRATGVVTINSTVGIEAKIIGKEVITLGDCFYSEYGDDEISRYISGFLLDIDYFSDVPISYTEARRLFERMQ